MTPARPKPQLARGAPRIDAAQIFAHTVCIACFCLQRFGLPFGGGTIFAAVVIVPPMFVGLLLSGRARIRSSTALLFVLLVCCLLGSALGGVAAPDPRMRFSLLSIIELFLIYSMFIIEPGPNLDTSKVLKIFVFYIRLISILSLLQYALQFAHIRLFSFVQLVPALSKISTEPGFNVVAIIKYGSPILRANGFFLLEPSILSQMIVIGIVADYFVMSRKLFLPIYAAAILASYSGTGPLALGVTLVIMGLLSPSQLPRTLGFLVVAAAVVGIAALAFPAEFATLAGRASGNDASASARYAGQLDIFRTIVNDPRLVFGFGPGAADGYTEHTTGSMSPALKLVFDYGAVGLLVFTTFLVKAIWRADKPILPVMCLVVFQLGGGGLLFGPWLFIMALICIWTRPTAALASARARAPIGVGSRRIVLSA